MALSAHSRNMLWIFLGDIGGRALGFVATAYLARVLGAAGFGVINIGLAVLNYGMLAGNCGLTLYGTARLSGDSREGRALTGKIVVARILLSLAAFLSAGAVIVARGKFGDLPEIILIYLLYLFPAAVLMEWYFQGRQRMGVIAVGRMVGMAAFLLMVLLTVHSSADLVQTAWAWLSGGVVNALLLWAVFAGAGYRIQWKGSLRFRGMLREAFPLGVAALVSQVVLQFPVLYLGWFAGTTDVGLFSAAFKITVLLLICDRVFHNLFFPLISRHARLKPAELAATVNRTLRLMTFAALSVSLAAILLSPLLIELVFGPEFLDAVILLQLMVAYFFLTLLISVVGFTLVGMGKEKAFMRAQLSAMLAFFLAVFTLPPWLGSPGVAGALILYEMVALAMMTITLRRCLPLNFFRSVALPTGGTLLLLLPALVTVPLALPLRILAIPLICLPLLIWWGGLQKEDWLYLKGILLWN